MNKPHLWYCVHFSIYIHWENGAGDLARCHVRSPALETPAPFFNPFTELGLLFNNTSAQKPVTLLTIVAHILTFYTCYWKWTTGWHTLARCPIVVSAAAAAAVLHSWPCHILILALHCSYYSCAHCILWKHRVYFLNAGYFWMQDTKQPPCIPKHVVKCKNICSLKAYWLNSHSWQLLATAVFSNDFTECYWQELQNWPLFSSV